MEICGNISFSNIISHTLLLRVGSGRKREALFPILNFGTTYGIRALVNTNDGIMSDAHVFSFVFG